ncbi:MAG: RNA polymerase sigma factor [Bacteroidia bacterium]
MTTHTLNFESLIAEYEVMLRNYAIKCTRDEDDANDLIQDTLVKAYTYFANFKQGTNFRGWLLTIMKNTFINNYHKGNRKQAIIVTEEDISSNNLMLSSTRNSAEARFIGDDIYKALDTLPSTLYHPFMRYFEGYKYHEIAIESGLPVGTVKTRIHHARLLLKKYLKTYEELKGKID